MILIDLKSRLPMGGQQHILKTLSQRPIFLEVFHIFIKNSNLGNSGQNCLQYDFRY